MDLPQHNFSFMDLLLNPYDDAECKIGTSVTLDNVESLTKEDLAVYIPLIYTGIATPFPDNAIFDKTLEMETPAPGPSSEAHSDISPSLAQNDTNHISKDNSPFNDEMTNLTGGDDVNYARTFIELKNVCRVVNPDSTATNPSPLAGVATFFENIRKDKVLERDTPFSAMDSNTNSYAPPTMAHNSSSNVSKTLYELEKIVCNMQQMPGENQRDEKPPHSFIVLISMAILSSPEGKMIVNDIYRYISQKFSYYKMEQKNWKGSVRYNLCVHKCFKQVGKNEKGSRSYWAVHPDCENDFRNGDYRRYETRKRVRRIPIKPRESNVVHEPMPYNPYTSLELSSRLNFRLPASIRLHQYLHCV